MKKTLIISIFVWMMVTLFLGCGGGGSNPGNGISAGSGDGTEASDSKVNSTNSAPIANAGMDQTISIGRTASLDGTGSADPDGDILSFQWTLNPSQKAVMPQFWMPTNQILPSPLISKATMYFNWL